MLGRCAKVEKVQSRKQAENFRPGCRLGVLGGRCLLSSEVPPQFNNRKARL